MTAPTTGPGSSPDRRGRDSIVLEILGYHPETLHRPVAFQHHGMQQDRTVSLEHRGEARQIRQRHRRRQFVRAASPDLADDPPAGLPNFTVASVTGLPLTS